QPRPQPKVVPRLLDQTQCPDCVCDERLTIEERTFKYCRSTVRNDHFDDQRLEERERRVGPGGVIRCNHPQCRDDPLLQSMKTLDAFRNHVKVEHEVSLRTTKQVMDRRNEKPRQRRMLKNGFGESYFKRWSTVNFITQRGGFRPLFTSVIYNNEIQAKVFLHIAKLLNGIGLFTTDCRRSGK
ncbi:FluG domain-containing protein, partial [Colletotrichum orchidophilum]